MSARDLSLIPLQPRHMADFFSQYSDDIAQLCKLPYFDVEPEKSWLEWLEDCQQQSTAHLLAIYHPDWGFIGSICFDIYAGRGFFYYWLGADFRGLGLGPQAVQQALDWAVTEFNLDCCYAITFEHNIASQKALKKLNFRGTGLKIDDSEDDYEDEDVYGQELVFYRGKDKADQALMLDLNQLFIEIDSELVVKYK